MKRPIPLSSSLVPLLVSAQLSVVAQSFAPVNATTRRLFANTDRSHTYSLAFDSAVVNGDTTSYFNFCAIRDTMVPSACGWWGGQECLTMDVPTWAGRRIDAAASGTHVFHNVLGEELTFDFNTDPGSETLIYADADQQFIMHHEGSGNYTVLGQIESVQQWSVLHLDEFGTVINSELNNALVEIGETMGLLRFVRIDSFPSVLEPVELVGQSEPALGFHEITWATLEDHQPGDEVQFHETYDLYYGPPWADYDRYRKYIYLTRDDQPNFVDYTVRQELFDAGSLELTIDTITLHYLRTEMIAAIPFERYDGTWPRLFESDYCGTPRWTYVHEINAGTFYCPEENCWGPGDTGGPPTQGATTYVPGVGIFEREEYISSPSGYDLHYGITYFRKDGVDCFEEVLMGASSVSEQNGPTVFPNPSEGLVSVSSAQPITGAEVLDELGNLIMQTTSIGQRGQLDLRALADGLYVVRLRFVDGAVGSQCVVIQH